MPRWKGRGIKKQRKASEERSQEQGRSSCEVPVPEGVKRGLLLVPVFERVRLAADEDQESGGTDNRKRRREVDDDEDNEDFEEIDYENPTPGPSRRSKLSKMECDDEGEVLCSGEKSTVKKFRKLKVRFVFLLGLL